VPLNCKSFHMCTSAIYTARLVVAANCPTIPRRSRSRRHNSIPIYVLSCWPAARDGPSCCVALKARAPSTPYCLIISNLLLRSRFPRSRKEQRGREREREREKEREREQRFIKGYYRIQSRDVISSSRLPDTEGESRNELQLCLAK
jgi:hypothetical protein